MSLKTSKLVPVIALGFAAVATWIFYAILYGVVRSGPTFSFFCDRGIYQHASVFFFLLGIALVLGRWLSMSKEESSLGVDLGSGPLDQSAASTLDAKFPSELRETLLGRRVSQLVKGFRRGEELGPLEARLADSDEQELEESTGLISLVRSLPPVIGLIGTLAGLRSGIAQIAQMSGGQSVEQIRSSLQGFAGSSSVAFDATLLGILCALLVSVALFLVRLRETRLMAQVNLTADDLARRFGKISTAEKQWEGLSEDLIKKLIQSLDSTLQGRAGQFSESLAKLAGRGVESFQELLSPVLNHVSAEVITSMQTNLRHAETILDRSASLQQHMASANERLEATLSQTMNGIQRILVGLQQEVSNPRAVRIHVSSDSEHNANHHQS